MNISSYLIFSLCRELVLKFSHPQLSHAMHFCKPKPVTGEKKFIRAAMSCKALCLQLCSFKFFFLPARLQKLVWPTAVTVWQPLTIRPSVSLMHFVYHLVVQFFCGQMPMNGGLYRLPSAVVGGTVGRLQRYSWGLDVCGGAV